MYVLRLQFENRDMKNLEHSVDKFAVSSLTESLKNVCNSVGQHSLVKKYDSKILYKNNILLRQSNKLKNLVFPFEKTLLAPLLLTPLKLDFLLLGQRFIIRYYCSYYQSKGKCQLNTFLYNLKGVQSKVSPGSSSKYRSFN